jgi:DNA polymerase-3 subunit delta
VKIDSGRVEQVLSGAGQFIAVLFHGDDEGLIRELAGRLVVAVAGSLDDPFRVSDVEREAWARLRDEAAEQSLMGGRRVVRVRDATDAATAAVERCLAGPAAALLVIEGPGLGGKSRLKTLLERSDKAATVACYPMSDQDIAQLVRSECRTAGIAVQSDVVGWLVGQMGADRGLVRRELEKLILYVGEGGTLELDDARLCVGDQSGLSLEDALFAATAGDVAGTDRALELALSEGAAPVSVVRGGLMHVQRLMRARVLMEGGMRSGAAAKAVRPPVHFRRESSFTRALETWSLAGLQVAAMRLWEAERSCKQTGSPAEVICRNVLLAMAQRAASLHRG